jgi:hypothetical protein
MQAMPRRELSVRSLVRPKNDRHRVTLPYSTRSISLAIPPTHTTCFPLRALRGGRDRQMEEGEGEEEEKRQVQAGTKDEGGKTRRIGAGGHASHVTSSHPSPHFL